MKIAVEGCAHGELENIYNTIEHIEKENNITIDLLLCCGDFQATRNMNDLNSMAVPPKFRTLGSFHKYYSGEKLAPKLTIFIGGNHEASNYLQELPYGGWVAPNIYYMGYAGVINIAGLRIAGLSGIFKGKDYMKGRYEKPPYNEDSLRTCYHIRNLDVFRLKQLSGPVHIMMSHDWPTGITNHGNVEQLLKKKPFFKEDIENDSLGSRPCAELLESLKPDYWFAAHLHVKFAAIVKHDESICTNFTVPENKTTKFLALDKCLPRRNFLQIVDIPTKEEVDFRLLYDPEWLSILHETNHLLSIKKVNCYMPGPGSNERWDFRPTDDALDFVMSRFQSNLNIPKNFVATAPSHTSDYSGEEGEIKLNPQTTEFCEKLGIDDPLSLLLNEDGFRSNTSLNMSNFESSSFIGLNDSEDTFSTSHDLSHLKNSGRTPLKLPKPNIETAESSDCSLLTSTPIEKVEFSFQNSSSINQESLPTESTPVSDDKKEEVLEETGPKKFRRRNIALYASNEDE